MTDRELLEMAAKAGEPGQPWKWHDDKKCLCLYNEKNSTWFVEFCREGYGDPIEWNPLADDGDALRLLASMPSLWSLTLKFGAPSFEMSVAWGHGKGVVASEFAGEGIDRSSAIRRAIVRAAAAIGKAMP